jgi:type IV secretory pathway TrbL component
MRAFKMANFVSSGAFTKFLALIIMAVIVLGSGVLLAIILVNGVPVAQNVLLGLGAALGSGLTYFAKASGVQDGATIVGTAVSNVTGAMTTAINASPAVSPAQVPVSVQSASNSPVIG